MDRRREIRWWCDRCNRELDEIKDGKFTTTACQKCGGKLYLVINNDVKFDRKKDPQALRIGKMVIGGISKGMAVTVKLKKDGAISLTMS